MARSTQSGRKIGRGYRKPGHARYNAENRRFLNKLRRVRKHNGEKAAEEYDRKYRYDLSKKRDAKRS
jgi:hypothetical protein